MILAGQVIIQGVALTVTVKLQLSLLPEASVTFDFMVVTPSGKVEPEAGVEVTETPGQLSEITGAAKVTMAEPEPRELSVVIILERQVMVGF